jgi:pSer/pThr/pTyr-binding forkhead associated (FHA) protein
VYEVGDQPLTLGRDKNQTIQILDQGVSRAHAEIFKLGELFIIRDINSTNGTFVNSERIEEEVLKNSDEILIGNTLMQFQETIHAEGASDEPDEPMGISTVELAVEATPSTIRTKEPAGVKAVDSKSVQVSYDVSRALVQEGDVDSLITRALEIAMKAVEANQSYVLSVDLKTNKIEPRCRVARESDSGASKLSRAIVKHVVKTRRPTLCSDATVDDRFSYSESIVFRKIRSVICVPLFSGNEINAVTYFHKSDGPSFTIEDLELVSQVGLQLTMAIETASFERKAKKGLEGAVKALVQAMEIYDAKGQGHAAHVADFSQAIAMQLGLSRDEVYKIRLSALLHDVGKISQQKFEESGMLIAGKDPNAPDERHVYAGEKIVNMMEGGKDLLPGVRFHHERADGTGFPYKIKNADTPLMGRIIIVANAFENELHLQGIDTAKKSDVKDILKSMANRAGGAFDAEIVKALLICHRKDTLYRVPDIFGKS